MSVQFEWHGDLAKTMAKQGAAVGLREAASAVKDESNARAPDDSGNLIASSGVDVDGDALVAHVYYGPQSAPRGGKRVYAIVRHEALRQGGSPKYLERPLLAARRVFPATLAAAIRRVLS